MSVCMSLCLDVCVSLFGRVFQMPETAFLNVCCIVSQEMLSAYQGCMVFISNNQPLMIGACLAECIIQVSCTSDHALMCADHHRLVSATQMASENGMETT